MGGVEYDECLSFFVAPAHDKYAQMRLKSRKSVNNLGKGVVCFGYETYRIYVFALRQEANSLCGGGKASTGEMPAQAGR